MVGASGSVCAAINSVADLQYGTVLYGYYQQDYFTALVNHEYVKAIGNERASSDSARVLKGGMSLSYGLTDYSHKVFQELLNEDIEESARNRAWFYLANMHFFKGDIKMATDALLQIHGAVPNDVHQRYHYLATLINIQNKHLSSAEDVLFGGKSASPYEPYLLFNLAITQLESGDRAGAKKNLQRVTKYADNGEEYATLSDRARHALSLVSVQDQDMISAWSYLQGVGTSGLYSNRALLTYSWAAINLERFEKAIPALQILDKRSIAIPEVQETKVLLPHLYEKQGAKRKALKGYLLAVKEFERGIEKLDEARRIIAKKDVPEEFVVNLEAIMDDSDWFGTQPSVDYSNLTPFLIELMASNAFQESLKELADLYAIRKNLLYWKDQSKQHELVLSKQGSSLSAANYDSLLAKSDKAYQQYSDQILELRLHVQTLETPDQKRFTSLLDTSQSELELLEDKVTHLKNVSRPYRHTKDQKVKVKELHKRIDQELRLSNKLIDKIEPVMRAVVNSELDKHEERMRYYWAQARLAKARLYDSTLLNLENESPGNKVPDTRGSK